MNEESELAKKAAKALNQATSILTYIKENHPEVLAAALDSIKEENDE